MVNTGLPDYAQKLGKICMSLKPIACLESISGQTTGEMLEYLSFGGVLILYGLLSE